MYLSNREKRWTAIPRSTDTIHVLNELTTTKDIFNYPKIDFYSPFVDYEMQINKIRRKPNKYFSELKIREYFKNTYDKHVNVFKTHLSVQSKNVFECSTGV